MTAARFLETRGPAWDRLEELLEAMGRRGVGTLSEEQLHELTRLYPAVAVDVARARLYHLDPTTQSRINRLAVQAHSHLYRGARPRPLLAIWRFFRWDYPRLFRRLWAYVVLAVVIFLVGGLGAYASVVMRPSTAYRLVPFEFDMVDGSEEVTAEDISERFRHMDKPPMATGIVTNNIRVSFVAFALGITAGIGTCYIVLFNAIMLGGFAGHFASHQLSYEFWSFIAGHGILEIFAILVSSGAGLRLGISLALPGRLTRRESLRQGGLEAVLLVLGTIPMFVVAGLVETLITPSYLPGGLKILLGVLLGGGALAYVLLTARGPEPTGLRDAALT
ncbi:MAG: stage II sporulation protein M [Phycisphaerae bacterium]|nr:stage II sporulation protein M [Phycisphaerae bacterium]